MFYARTRILWRWAVHVYEPCMAGLICHISVVLILVEDGLESGGSGYQHAADSVSR